MNPSQLRFRTFYFILATQTISLIGSRLSALALGFLVYRQTQQVTVLALIQFFDILPSIFISPISGMVADRLDRRKIMIVADIGSAIGTVLLLLSVVSGAFQVWHLYAVTFLQATCAVFQRPAIQASVTMLVPDEQRPRANALFELSLPMAGIFAPVIAGLIFAVVGVAGAIVIDLLTFIIAISALVIVRIPAPPKSEEGQTEGGFLRQLTAGFAFLWSRRPLFILVSAFTLTNFFFTLAFGLETAYPLARTGSEAVTGTLLGISSAGIVIGGAVLAWWGGTRRRIHTMMPAVLATCVGVVLIGMAQQPIVLGAALFVTMFAFGFINAPFNALVQAKVPPDLQGRVFSAIYQLSFIFIPIAYLLSGFLADQIAEPAAHRPDWAFAGWVGTGDGAGMGLIYVVCGLVMAAFNLFVYALPMVRQIDVRLPDAQPENSIE